MLYLGTALLTLPDRKAHSNDEASATDHKVDDGQKLVSGAKKVGSAQDEVFFGVEFVHCVI